MPVWPVTLPAMTTVEDYKEEPADRTLRTQMDEGPDKTRLLTTAEPDTIRFMQKLTAAQTADMDTFYKTTLSGGSITFDDLHPRTGASETFRFKTPPTYEYFNTYWKVNVELEVMP